MYVARKKGCVHLRILHQVYFFSTIILNRFKRCGKSRKDANHTLQIENPALPSQLNFFNMSATVHNFNAGPSILPKTVFEEASAAVLNFNNSGLSILELGHRTPEFTAVMEEARALVKELMQLDAAHEVLFLHGGASTQFMQVPMNLL